MCVLFSTLFQSRFNSVRGTATSVEFLALNLEREIIYPKLYFPARESRLNFPDVMKGRVALSQYVARRRINAFYIFAAARLEKFAVK